MRDHSIWKLFNSPKSDFQYMKVAFYMPHLSDFLATSRILSQLIKCYKFLNTFVKELTQKAKHYH